MTVVGEPGLGKSRLVAELFAYIDARPELHDLAAGALPPLRGGDHLLGARGDPEGAHRHPRESTRPRSPQEKLAAVLPEGDEREWFRQRLLPLLGIEATSTAEREELFTAWRRFLEQIAEERPTVLVFEDLHWADEALLAFLEHLADLAEGVPLLLVGTARPELYERHPEYATRLRNATPITLAPLSQEETARLVSALLETTVIPAELQQPILERAGGNPLYAEEFVRLLKDRDLLERVGSSWQLKDGAEVPFPESVQALIAARLDTLEPEAKSLLADAAVIGKVFWAGALAAMGEREPESVVSTLRELSRKELVRPLRQSSMAGEAEYAFWHVLARDVAYSQLPRASRAARHVAAAGWIESKAPERVEDLADVLAYHYATALELARAAGDSRAGRRARGTGASLPLARRGARPRPRHRRRPRELRAGARAHPSRATRNGPRRSPASARPLSTPDASPRRRTRSRRRSAPSRRRATFVGPLGRWARSPTCSSARRSRAGRTCLPRRSRCSEPLPPGPELVSALTELARAEALQGRERGRGAHAEQALALAERARPAPPRARPRLPRPGALRPRRPRRPRRLPGGDRARHRGRAGTRGGRPAQQPRGGAVGVRGPGRSSGGRCAPGSPSRRTAGSPRWSTCITGSTVDPLFGHGRARAGARRSPPGSPTTRRPSGNALDLTTAQAVQARILTLRGQAAQVADTLDWLEVDHPRGGRARVRRHRPGRRPPSLAPHSDRPTQRPPCSPRSTRRPASARSEYYAVYLPDDGAHRPRARRPAARRTARGRRRAAHPL